MNVIKGQASNLASVLMDAKDSIEAIFSGMALTVRASAWVQTNDKYVNTITVSTMTGNEVITVLLSRQGNPSDDVINFYDVEIEEINTTQGAVVITATSACAEDFTILVTGNIKVDNLIMAGGSTETQAPEFLTDQSYEVGDYVIYNDILYKCTTAVTAGSAFDAASWTSTSIAEELKAVNASLNGLSFGVDETTGTLSITY